MENKETIGKLKNLLGDAKFSSGGEIFISGEGIFVNCKGQYIVNYDVLVKFEMLRQAVNRAFDYVSTLEEE